MKALSIASLFMIGLAGTACSQAADSEPETPAADVQTAEAGDGFGGSFNLELPSDLNETGAASNDGFNLDVSNTTATSTDGFNLDTDLQASSGLESVPEIQTGINEEEPEQPVDDEPVIRIP